MRQKVFGVIALVVLFVTSNSVWALGKFETCDVVTGGRPAVVADKEGNLHMVYESPITYEVSRTTSSSEDHSQKANVVLPGIWYSQSKNIEKDKWTESVGIKGLPGSSHQPDIAIEKDGELDIVWTGSQSTNEVTDIFFTRSTDDGHTWSKPVDISNTPGNSSEPAIAIAPDNSIHVVWSDTSRGEEHKDIYYSYSKDGGKTWGKDALLPADDISNTPGESSQPTIGISKNGAIYVAWLDNTSGETHPDIYYAYKTDGDWSKPVNVSNSSRVSSHPSIACGGNTKIYLSWSDNSKKEHAADIWCAIANENGPFGRPINISNTPGVSSEPAIAADENGNIAIVWSDTSKISDKPDVYCRISSNSGNGFSGVMDLSHNTGMNKHPDVTIVDNNMLVTWEVSDGSNKQIKLTSLELKNIAIGPVLNVTPDINLHASK